VSLLSTGIDFLGLSCFFKDFWLEFESRGFKGTGFRGSGCWTGPEASGLKGFEFRFPESESSGPSGALVNNS